LERCGVLKRIGPYFKSFGVLAIVALFVFLLVACRNELVEQDEVHINNDFFESYAYRVDVDSSFDVYVSDFIHGTLVHEGRIYFYYVETEVVELEVDADGNVDIDTLEPPVSTIIIESMYPDGTSVSRTEIANAGKFISIAGFRITEAGNFTLVFTDSNFAHLGADTYLIYAEYSPQGVELLRHEIPEITPRGSREFYARQALFIENGIALLATTDNTTFLYLLDEQFSIRSQTELEAGTRAMIPMVQTRDGRLLVYFSERTRGTHRSTLREFDLESADWGERFPISATDILALYPASATTDFDFYIDDGVHLFGYNLEAEEKTTILNWPESRISAGLGSHLNFLDNGQISILTDRSILSDDRYIEHTILNRIDRADLPDYTIVTLGGVYITHLMHIREQVLAFNQQSQTHQIEIVDYFDPSGDINAYIAAHTRFSIDLMTGRAPDIIYGDSGTMSPIAEAGLLLDLYEFIDNDPDLDRSDFIPNILASQEASDGSLPAVFYSFRLHVLVGMADIVGDPEAWNLDKFLSLVEEATSTDMETIIRSSHEFDIRPGWFVRRIMSDPSHGFINLEENIADLDNDEFIRILEIASYFPDESPLAADDLSHLATIDAQSVGVARMRRGEILFSELSLSRIRYYQINRRIIGEDMVPMGWPSQNGGNHRATALNGIGISANSNSSDEAWEFVREFLLPEVANMYFSPLDTLFTFRFPLRVDILEDLISEAMIPLIREDANGNEVEVPRNLPYTEALIHFTTPVYALTEAEAEEFREIIANSTMDFGFDEAITNILREELPIFLAGSRSADDTARVLQNRIQRFLDERS